MLISLLPALLIGQRSFQEARQEPGAISKRLLPSLLDEQYQ